MDTAPCSPTRLSDQTAFEWTGSIDVIRRCLSLAVSDEPSADLCLPDVRIAAHEKHAGIGMGWSTPTGSDVFVYASQSVPRQDFLGPTADELRVLAHHRLALDGSSHIGKGLPKMTAIRTGGPQGGHRSIQAFEVTAKLGSVHGPEYRQCGRTA